MKITRLKSDTYASNKELAQYMGLPDSLVASKGDELSSAIERATCTIENKHNVSLRNQTVRLHTFGTDKVVNLYLGEIAEIESVKESGVAVSKFTLDGDKLRLATDLEGDIEVVYTTSASPEVFKYKIEALERAAKIFNGNE
ncbi:MAG: hypothetical protein R3Y39_08980 [Rikenellaceae bacterium]